MYFNIDHRHYIVVRWAHYSTDLRVAPKRVYTKISPNLVPPTSSDVATYWQVDPKTDSPTRPEHDENNDEEGEEHEPNKGPSASQDRLREDEEDVDW